MSLTEKLYLLPCASGVAGADAHAGDGPVVMSESKLLDHLDNVEWLPAIHGKTDDALENTVLHVCTELAHKTAAMVKDGRHFAVIGGDHSCAMGTWSGVQDAIKTRGDLGLIWVDAHMDSHTPETSESGRIHGMPLAALMGKGKEAFTSILNKDVKIKPENVCLIGIRSYEKGEAALLKDLNVRVYFMEEVVRRGFYTVLLEAMAYVKRNTVAFGLSFDLDAIDPAEAPGVDVPEPDGIHVDEFMTGLRDLVRDPALIATEIVEFDPMRDVAQKTEKLVASCIEVIANGG